MSGKWSEAPCGSYAQQPSHRNTGTGATAEWKSSAPSKLTLRHIENHIVAGPGTAVVLDSVMDCSQKKYTKTTSQRDGSQFEKPEESLKPRINGQLSPKKSSSRSPLRNATQDCNVHKNSVEFQEPLASYREATPPPYTSSQLEAHHLQSVPGSSLPSSSLLSGRQLLSHVPYRNDRWDVRMDRDFDHLRSIPLASNNASYLNDQPVLDTQKSLSYSSPSPDVRFPEGKMAKNDPLTKVQFSQSLDSEDSSTCATSVQCSVHRGDSSVSSSPGSVSLRLRNLRRHQADDKLEKLKERIRRQRQHLEEAAEKDKLAGYLEKPIIAGKAGNGTDRPSTKIRKRDTAAPAPVFKGFNSTQIHIQTPDGKVLKEEDFHNFSREIYKDLSQKLTDVQKSKVQQHSKPRSDRSKERKAPSAAAKVHRAVSEQNPKSVISPASWREGQKLVKMVLGPASKVTREDGHLTNGGLNQTASRPSSSSASRSKSNRDSRHNSRERSQSADRGQSSCRVKTSGAQDKPSECVNSNLLSADIQGILNDLQLECEAAEQNNERRRGRSVSRRRAPVSAWGPTAASMGPTKSKQKATSASEPEGSAKLTNPGPKKRHYDADAVRLYIAKQQEERRRRQAEERQAVTEEMEKRNQRLQKLYRTQREVAKAPVPSEVSVAPIQNRLHETYNKLLSEEAQLDSEASQIQSAAPSFQLGPMYQPSGESDKENVRVEAPQSPSSSDRSLNDQQAPSVTRNFSGLGFETSTLRGVPQPWDPSAPAVRSAPSTQLRIEALKATATSLSNRVENEARNLAGQRINFGVDTSAGMDSALNPGYLHAMIGAGDWEGRESDVPLRIQRILSGIGHSSSNDRDLPASENLNTFREQKEQSAVQTNFPSQLPAFKNRDQDATSARFMTDRAKLVNGFGGAEKTMSQKKEPADSDMYKNHTNLPESSGSSISEGTLLSEGEGALSDRGSPAHLSNSLHGPQYGVDRGHKLDFHHLLEFQKEAAKYSGLTSSFTQQDQGKAAWEELNNGSPLSVINIFTKNFQNQAEVSERNSRSARSSHCSSPENAGIVENDFHSSATNDHSHPDSKSHSRFELQRGSSFERYSSSFNSHHSSAQSPHLSAGSDSSPVLKFSNGKLGPASDQSGGTLVGEDRSLSSSRSKVVSPESRPDSQNNSFHCSDPLPHQSLGQDNTKSSASRPLISPSGILHHDSLQRAQPASEPLRTNSWMGTNKMKTISSEDVEATATGGLQYSPAVLHQQMTAELQNLESIEECARQLEEVERLMGVSMAKQETASMAQMLLANQQRHERDIYELKIKAEREALEAQLQLEENKKRVAMAHMQLQEAVTQKETLEDLQDATTKMLNQQAEAARHNADAARHIKEMAEMARSQVSGALTGPPLAANSSIWSRHTWEENSRSPKRNDTSDSVSSTSRTRPEKPVSSSLSHPDSPPLSRSNQSHQSPSNASADHAEPAKKEESNFWKRGNDMKKRRETGSSSIEEEIPTAANDSLCSDSIPSIVEEKGDTTSVATEYSMRFDNSMTEDELEEQSFRSLLPSEGHRRETLEKKSHLEDSEVSGPGRSAMLPSGSLLILKESTKTFFGAQDSFSQFTMDMVRQYMKDEDVRLQHQSSLLALRQKALKENIRTELAWLEHQKKKLRDKGEDDKMPPIRKKQRGLLIRLQQEQAEIRRLQEANKAARKEGQLLLKQQEEIERMRNSTSKLKERLKSAGYNAPSEPALSDTPVSEAASITTRHTDDGRSPSPALSVSGSETSSIMQKLKKMRSHMDEKLCSPVHYFFSVFTAQHWASLSVCLPKLHPKFQLFIFNQLVRFLTKREQQLMQRRHHAEELLQWKQRLDQEEAEVQRIEKEALAGWDGDGVKPGSQKLKISALSPTHLPNLEPKTDSEKEYASEADISSATPESSIHTEPPAAGRGPSAGLETEPDSPLTSIQTSCANYPQDFTSLSSTTTRQSSAARDSAKAFIFLNDDGRKTVFSQGSQIHDEIQSLVETPRLTHTEASSDQSDIETRIKVLKEELRKRKLMALQLKREQKKRQKEHLKAKEASLLKELESYDVYIEKTKAELNKRADLTVETKSLSKVPTSIAKQKNVNAPSQRYETSKVPEKIYSSIDKDLDKSTSVPEELSAEDQRTLTPTPVNSASGHKSHQSIQNQQRLDDVNIISDVRSLQDELDLDLTSTTENLNSPSSQPSSQLENKSGKLHSVKSADWAIMKAHPCSTIDKDKQSKDRFESEQIINSKSISPPAEVGLETSHDVGTCSPQSQENKVSFAHVDRYTDDFESAVDSSHHSSNVASEISEPPARIKAHAERVVVKDSRDDELEEEIAEEQSIHCVDTSEVSHDSVRLLVLDRPAEESTRSQTPSMLPSQGQRSPDKDEMPTFNIADRVLLGGVQPGTLRFKGPTSFANGYWAGVELDQSQGSNNGTYDGVVYFKCAEGHGIFAPPDKITHLPAKFESYTETTDEEDFFFDDLSKKGGNKNGMDAFSQMENNNKQEHKSDGFRDKYVTDDCVPSDQNHVSTRQHPVLRDGSGDIILELEDAPTSKETLFLDKSSDVISNHHILFKATDGVYNDQSLLDKVTDKIVKSLVADTVTELAQIKKAKEQKIAASSRASGHVVANEEESMPTVEQKDGLPFFLPGEQNELLSPELCNQPESPVLGASGQEELAKRLAELELNRELLDELGDDQDWFDEDFGLSSRREAERLKQREEKAKVGGGLGRSTPSEDGDQQAKTPPRPALPLPLPPKLPEQPAMVVPHSATEVEKMVHVAVQEIWENCGLAKQLTPTLANVPRPEPSLQYLGSEASAQDQEALCIRSYRKAVYDLSWEILREIYAEDPDEVRPLWVKPRRVKCSLFHRVKTPGDIATVQDFVTAEVLKLYGLSKEPSQKTDWQKMLKFGRKKRDRVDHILVQELHEEEFQWVNYDEDELFVKMQLADSIFDMLLKDTADVLNEISQKRTQKNS
ncbi:centrosome-associated protein 350 isoform X2 [Synchiropus splendidus]|uniref:centrosome-associated protein 350 isoform X2 n=1 Tax=Synchiropus splendidus TaxID=270530 RepID=UPI00237E1555|nr:centrosome-associated protein 350 isoform X2 [Synchiropus splendidus]